MRGGISVEVRAEPASKGLRMLWQRIENREPINRKVGIQLYAWVMRNFDSGGREQEPSWAPLADSTLKQKARLGYSPQPLIRTGHLRQSFAPFADDRQAGVGAQASFGVDYAELHETGTSRFPARPMLPPERVAIQIATQVYDLELTAILREGGLK